MPDDVPSSAGSTLHGRYRLEDPIGQGGTAFVYAATDVHTGDRAAIKVLRARYISHEHVLERFLREAKAAARVRHPHVVEIRDFGTSQDGQVFTVMEHLDGETLSSTIEREGALPWSRVRHLMLQLCAALGEAHRVGVVYRDVTLTNIFRIRREADADFVKLVDFGLARLQECEPQQPAVARLTSDVEVFGTPSFMAPEQVRRSFDADPRSDVYSAGIVFFALLVGRLPFVGKSATHVLQLQVDEPAPSPRRFVRDIPADAEAIVLCALEKEPDHRFQSMEAFAAAIESVAADVAVSPAARKQSRVRPAWLLGLAALALVLAVLLAFT